MKVQGNKTIIKYFSGLKRYICYLPAGRIVKNCDRGHMFSLYEPTLSR